MPTPTPTSESRGSEPASAIAPWHHTQATADYVHGQVLNVTGGQFGGMYI